MQDPSKPIWIKQKPQLEVQAAPFSIFVATPVHSDVSIHFAQALLEFQKACVKRKVSVQFQFTKSSLVTQGRNLCVNSFLETSMTHMLFIDSDIDFDAEGVFKMIEADKEIISIPYPMKIMQWGKLFEGVKTGSIKDTKTMSTRGYMYPMVLDNDEDIRPVNGVIEVKYSPAGCMLIKRQVYKKMIEKYPNLKIVQKTIYNDLPEIKPYLYNFWDTWFNEKTNEYMGEDFSFCKRWKDIGGKCYAYINSFITHVGEFQYCGKFADELIKNE